VRNENRCFWFLRFWVIFTGPLATARRNRCFLRFCFFWLFWGLFLSFWAASFSFLTFFLNLFHLDTFFLTASCFVCAFCVELIIFCEGGWDSGLLGFWIFGFWSPLPSSLVYILPLFPLPSSPLPSSLFPLPSSPLPLFP
jgi:hypothetical protein